VTTTDIELMDAFLNAPAGLDGLAADMAYLAQREPTNDRPQDAQVIIERANALADKWEQVGTRYLSLPEAACELRLALAPHPHRRTRPTSRRSTC
jgi:hypothetical protein